MEQNTLLRLNFVILRDNCLLRSRSTTGPKHHPKSGVLKSPVWPSSRTSRPWLELTLWKDAFFWMKRIHFLTPGSTSAPGKRHCALLGLGVFEEVQQSTSALPGRDKLMASLWQQQLGSSTEHEETSVGILAWLHVRQGTCVHLRIYFCFQTPVLGSC